MVEDHDEALLHWARRGYRDAVLIHFDTHDDVRHIPEDRIAALGHLRDAGDWEEFARSAGSRDDALYGIGNWIYAATRLGIVRETYWIVPFAFFAVENTEERLRTFLGTYGFHPEDIAAYRMAGGCFRGTTRGVPFNVCGMESLPVIDEPVLLTIDADGYPTLSYEYGESRLDALAHLMRVLGGRDYRVMSAVVAYSVNGGYLRATDRWVGEAAGQLLREPWLLSGNPPERWEILQRARTLRKAGKAREGLATLAPHVREYPDDPAGLLEMAALYFDLGDLDRTYVAADMACGIDRVNCFGLVLFGTKLLKNNHLADADRFFRRGYEMNPEMDYGQMRYGIALREAKRYDEALRYFTWWKRINGSYPVDFMLGDTWRRMGNPEKARYFYDLAVVGLSREEYPDLNQKSVITAVRGAVDFLEERGLNAAAGVIRDHPALAAAFPGDGEG